MALLFSPALLLKSTQFRRPAGACNPSTRKGRLTIVEEGRAITGRAVEAIRTLMVATVSGSASSWVTRAGNGCEPCRTLSSGGCRPRPCMLDDRARDWYL